VAYGDPNSEKTELDHLVSLELGGSNDARNLWPETPRTPNPKDQIEGALNRAVCSGKVTLRAAQVAIAETVLGFGMTCWEDRVASKEAARRMLNPGPFDWASAEVPVIPLGWQVSYRPMRPTSPGTGVPLAGSRTRRSQKTGFLIQRYHARAVDRSGSVWPPDRPGRHSHRTSCGPVPPLL
jgi:hypothetical protein